MSKVLTAEAFDAMRAEFPGSSPAALYDVACVRLEVPATWETTSSFAKSLWMNAFANAPTSYLAH